MPNFQFTSITINGKKEVIDELMKSVVATKQYLEQISINNAKLQPQFRYFPSRLDEVDFNILIPQPDYITNDNSDKENNWYEWCTENWGTKNNYNSYVERVSDEEVYLSFQTAWTPPYQWLNALANKAKEIGVKYLRGITSYDFPIDYYRFKLNLKSGKLQYRCFRDVDAYNAAMNNN